MNHAEVRSKQSQAAAAIVMLVTLTIIARLTGYNGAAYIAAAAEVCAFIYTVAGGGLANVLGRLLRVRNAKGQYRNAAKLRRNVMLLQLVLGALGTVFIMIFSGNIAERVFHVQYSALILLILSPVVFLRSVSAVLTGYSKGEGSELPSAAAGILRQVFILIFSVVFCKMLGGYGSKVSRLLMQENFTSMYGGVGVALAVTLTEILIVIFLLVIYRGTRRSKAGAAQDGMRAQDSFMDSVRILCGGRGIQAGALLLAILPAPLGLIFLQRAAEGSGQAALEYGAYLVGYGVTCGIPAALVMMLILPICGQAAGHLRRDEQRFARLVFQGGVHIGVVHTAFPVAFLAVMSGQIAAVMCPGQAEISAKMLAGGSSVILFIVLSLYFSRILILSGKRYLVIGALIIADVLYAVTATVLLNTGKVGILALVYSGIMGSGVLCVSLSMLAYRQMRQRPDWLHVLVVPVVMACVAGLVCMLLGRVFTPHLGELVSSIVCFVLAGALYWAGLLLLRNFREQELEIIPGGKLINSIGQMLHVYY